MIIEVGRRQGMLDEEGRRIMELDTTVGEGRAVVRLNGRLTMVVAGDLRALVTESVEAGRNRIVVDLGACEFVDSSGLGALVGGLKTARQTGGDLRIARLHPQVATVLRLTNLDRVLRAYSSVDEAFAST